MPAKHPSMLLNGVRFETPSRGTAGRVAVLAAEQQFETVGELYTAVTSLSKRSCKALPNKGEQPAKMSVIWFIFGFATSLGYFCKEFGQVSYSGEADFLRRNT